jgi:sentrin-specific protease 1
MTSIAREIESDVDCIDAYADQFLEQSTESDVGGIGTGGAIFGRSLMNKFGFGKKKRQEEHLMARRYEWTNTFRYLRNAPDIRDAKITTWDDAQSILKRVVTFPTSDRLEDGDHNDAGVMIDKVDDHGETSQSLKKNHMKNFEATLARLSIGADFTSANNKWRKVAEVANSISLQNVDDEKLKEYASMRKMDLEYNARLDTQDKKDKAYRESSVVKEIEERQKAKEAAKRASSLMRPLSDEELDLVERAVNGYSLAHNAIVAQDGSDSVQQSSMHTLQPGQWVGDEVIHYFYHMLSKRDKEMCDNDPSRRPSHFFKSFFMTKLLNEGHASKDGQYEYNNVKRWSKKVPGKDLFGLNKIFFPINMGNAHWIAACIFMEKKRIEIFDSMGGSGRVYLDALFQYLKDEHMSKNGSPLPHQDQWELVPTQRDTPRQRNGYDCGVFTCMFADFVSKDCPLVFNQDHINQCRHRIALSILNGKAIM